MFSSIQDRQYGLKRRARIYDATRGSLAFIQRLKLETKLEVHSGCVNTICWNSSGQYILSGSDDQHLVLSNPFSKNVVANIHSGHRSNIFSAKFLPSSRDRHIISCSGAGKIFFTEVDREDTYGQNRFDCHYGTTYEVITVPNEASTFLSCGEDGTVRWYDLRIKTSCSKENCKDDVLINSRQAVTALAVDPMQPYHLAVGCSDSSVRIFDRRMLGTRATGNYTGRGMLGLVARFTAPGLGQRSYRITSLCYSPAAHDVLVSYSTENIYVFNSQRNDTTEYMKSGAGAEAERQADVLDDLPAGRPPVKRLRLRGDWSDTGPNARPEGERQREGAAGRESPHTTLMQRMSEMLTQWLDATQRQAEERRPESASSNPPQEFAFPPGRMGSPPTPRPATAEPDFPQDLFRGPQQSPSSGPALENSQQSPSSGPALENSQQSPSSGPALENSQQSPSSGPALENSQQSPSSGPALENSQQATGDPPTAPGSQDEVPGNMSEDPNNLDLTLGSTMQTPVEVSLAPTNPSQPTAENTQGPDVETVAPSDSAPVPSETSLRDLEHSQAPTGRESPMVDSDAQSKEDGHIQSSRSMEGGQQESEMEVAMDVDAPSCSPSGARSPGAEMKVNFKEDDLPSSAQAVSSPGSQSQPLPTPSASREETRPPLQVPPSSQVSSSSAAPQERSLLEPILHLEYSSQGTSASTITLAYKPVPPLQGSPQSQQGSSDQSHQGPGESPRGFGSPEGQQSGTRAERNTSSTEQNEPHLCPSVSEHQPPSSHVEPMPSCSVPEEGISVSVTKVEGDKCAPSDQTVIHHGPRTENLRATSAQPESCDMSQGESERGSTETSEVLQDEVVDLSTLSVQSKSHEDLSEQEVQSGSPQACSGSGMPAVTISDVDLVVDSGMDLTLPRPVEEENSGLAKEVTAQGEGQGGPSATEERMETDDEPTVSGEGARAKTRQSPVPSGSGRSSRIPVPIRVSRSPGLQGEGRMDEEPGTSGLHSSSTPRLSGSSRTHSLPGRSTGMGGESRRLRPFSARLERPPRQPTDDDSDSSDDDLIRNSPLNNIMRYESEDERHFPVLKVQSAFRRHLAAKEQQELNKVYQPPALQQYKGHRNSRTMIKEANFWGADFVMSGSDCGHIFIWDRHTARVITILEADRHVVNCLQPHPFDPVLASSGIDYDIKIWTPTGDGCQFDEEKAAEIIRRNEIMLDETRDTITVPAAFMLRVLASLNHIRSGRSGDGRARPNPANQDSSNSD